MIKGILECIEEMERGDKIKAEHQGKCEGNECIGLGEKRLLFVPKSAF